MSDDKNKHLYGPVTHSKDRDSDTTDTGEIDRDKLKELLDRNPESGSEEPAETDPSDPPPSASRQ